MASPPARLLCPAFAAWHGTPPSPFVGEISLLESPMRIHLILFLE
jgi:hypothetical protein